MFLRTFSKRFKRDYPSLSVITIFLIILLPSCQRVEFDGQRALGYIEQQLSFGYRIPGTEASHKTSLFIQDVLRKNNWNVIFQDFDYENVRLRNIVAYRDDSPPDIILGAHYDTRAISDQEKSNASQLEPVQGANDGASGTAVLLELSRHILHPDMNIWLVFFDAEDQGRIEDWPWSVGAEYFAANTSYLPQQVVIVDMVGDKDLEIYQDKNSSTTLTQEIWSIAETLGYQDIFINQPKYALIDDHLPFLNRGVPSSLIIDFDFPHWHTYEDTIDKVSAESLRIVGEVLLTWISSID